MTGPETVLSIKNLRIELNGRGLGRKTLVEDLDLAVHRGRVTGLVGESGCGKSMTCLAVMDLLPPGICRNAGRIEFSGVSLDDIPPSQWRTFRGCRAAMILQNPISCFDPVFSIARHVRETLKAHGLEHLYRDGAVHSTLVDMGFENPRDILAAFPFQLSGGMLQRVMVSLALLLGAELIIADEPTTDLDVVVQARILELIDRMRRERNVGVLLVTHDLSVIARLADRVAVMKDGRILEAGPVGDIFHRPSEEYTKALLAAHFSLYGRDPAREERT